MGTVIVVDDSKFQARNITNLVLELGYEAISFQSGAEVLEKIEQSGDSVTCLITDLLMPGMDGFELIRRVRMIRESLPIIVLSANKQVSVQEKTMDLGADVFLTKPPSQDQLKTALRKVLSTSGAA